MPPPPPPDDGPFIVELWDSKTDLFLATLRDDMVLDLSTFDFVLEDVTITIRASAEGEFAGQIEAVRLNFDNNFSYVDRAEPYALFGDGGGDLKGGFTLDAGEHEMNFEVFSSNNMKSKSLLDDFTMSFTVVDEFVF